VPFACSVFFPNGTTPRPPYRTFGFQGSVIPPSTAPVQPARDRRGTTPVQQPGSTDHRSINAPPRPRSCRPAHGGTASCHTSLLDEQVCSLQRCPEHPRCRFVQLEIRLGLRERVPITQHLVRRQSTGRRIDPSPLDEQPVALELRSTNSRCGTEARSHEELFAAAARPAPSTRPAQTGPLDQRDKRGSPPGPR